MASGEMIPPILHMDLPFEDYKRVESRSWNINALNQRHPFSIATLGIILFAFAA
jgi:hypothetical protein